MNKFLCENSSSEPDHVATGDMQASRADENYSLRIRAAERYLKFRVSSGPAKQLVEADIFEPVSLLETPIRKDDIPPTIAAVIGGLAHKSFLKAVRDGEDSGKRAKLVWKNDTVKSTASKLTDRYYGNVGAVVGTKLPVTPEFLDEYFTQRNIRGVLPESVVRLQFDATLKPTSPQPTVSRINTVIYQAINESGDQTRIHVTSRKADRMAAGLAIQSLLNEAATVSTVIDSNSYEVLAGLPTLGKNNR